MEYLLKNTDVFDLELYKKVNDLIANCRVDFNDDIEYELCIMFHLNLLESDKWKDYYSVYVPKKPYQDLKRGCRNDIYDYLSFVLDKVLDILMAHKIKLSGLTIAGDNIENEDSIVLTFRESTRNNVVQDINRRGKRKNTKRIICYNIMPSRPSIQKKIHNLVEQGINERFTNYVEITGTKVMSQILYSNETDDNDLFNEFVKQYATLWNLHSEGEVDELHEKFKKRAQFIWNKYYARENKISKPIND